MGNYLATIVSPLEEAFSGRRIGYPKIGAGLAGGDWEILSKIIDEELAGENHMLVEFAGQSEDITKHILQGFNQLSEMLESWIDEAKQEGLFKEEIKTKEVGSFIVTSFYGASALYAASRDPEIWKQTVTQLLCYLDSLKQ